MNTTLVSPWIDYFRCLEALFAKDPDVKVEYVEDLKVKVYVSGTYKYEALAAILPETVVFGNVILKIEVIQSNKFMDDTADLFIKAFTGNEAVKEISTASTIIGELTYIVFDKEVVQYRNDDIGDYHQVKSTLYQDIAEKVFSNGHDGVFFCTDVE